MNKMKKKKENRRKITVPKYAKSKKMGSEEYKTFSGDQANLIPLTFFFTCL